MRVRVRFFAGARDAAGAATRDIEVTSPVSVDGLFELLSREAPALARYRAHAVFARNGEFVTMGTMLSEGDEVAIMPPVSGGAGAVDPAPFSLDALIAATRTEGAGAVVTFTGLVRPTSNAAPDARVEKLTFEAYLPLAERALEEVRQDAIAKFGLIDATLRHRTGTLAAGESIVAVVVAARHRRDGFEAVAWIMDELKTRVPIWKQETDADGATRWINDVEETR